MRAYSLVPGTEMHLQSLHGASGALGQVSTGEGGLEGSPKSLLGHLETCSRDCLLCAALDMNVPCVSALIFGKLIPRGKNRKLWLHHATATLPVLGWPVGREMKLWAFML